MHKSKLCDVCPGKNEESWGSGYGTMWDGKWCQKHFASRFCVQWLYGWFLVDERTSKFKVDSTAHNIAMPKPEDIIGECDGCKHDLPNGSSYCESCCRCESLSDYFESPASA